MSDAPVETAPAYAAWEDRPRTRGTYAVDADLPTLAEELSDALTGMEERGYPVAGVYGPTPDMGTPIAVRCYDVGDDAALRLAHDTEPDDGAYTSRVTLHADTTERVEEVQEAVDAVMDEFAVAEHGFLDRLRAALPR